MSVLDLFRLDGRVAIVSGAAGLLGPTFAEALLEAGATVVGLDVDATRLAVTAAPLQNAFGRRYRAVPCDLRHESAVDAAVEAAASAGTPAILVNAAAVNPVPAEGQGQRFTDYPVDAWRLSMDVNLTGTFLVTRAVCRHFERVGAGVVVNLASTYGLVGPDQRLYQEGRTPPYFVKPGDYSTTKAGVIGFTRYLAAYYAGSGIRVNCLSPGGAYNGHDDAFTQAYASRTVLRRMASRDDYQGAMLFLCSDASRYMTGANLVVDGGWTAV